MKVKTGDGYTYYIAQALADTVLGEDYEVLETYKGKDLEYKEYEPLYDCSVPICEKQHKKAYYVVCDTYVTLTDGTGIVHIAPAFGEDDANVGRKYDLPFVQLVDAKGDMTAETPFAGKFVKDADPMVLKGSGGSAACCSPPRPLSTAIPTAGAAAPRSSTMPESPGSSR